MKKMEMKHILDVNFVIQIRRNVPIKEFVSVSTNNSSSSDRTTNNDLL